MDKDQFEQLLHVFTKTQQELLQQVKANSNLPQQQTPPQPTSHIMLPPFETFDEKKENFKLYLQRFENYHQMKGVFTNKTLCHQMLVNSIGSTHFRLLVSLIAPKSITDIKYEEVVAKLETHLCPKKNILVIQHRFLSTYQNEEQSVADFVALLRRDINNCAFISACQCNADISNIFHRAQFIRGIKYNTIREQLLQSEESDFEKLVQRALALEASKIDSRDLNSKPQTVVKEVNKVHGRLAGANRSRQTSRNRSSSRHSKCANSKLKYKQLGIGNLCIRCGKDNHKTKECRTNRHNLKCNSCGKRGHVQQVCIKTLMSNSSDKSSHKAVDGDEAIHQVYGINQIVDLYKSHHGELKEDVVEKYIISNGRALRIFDAAIQKLRKDF
ncbi:uncharacterized protein [Eurosta solidaginis]|uniref:uncharacterized protein n=1 Tax=Eurosta solidaginis TaxID=178769 RepID=UPI0035309EA7